MGPEKESPGGLRVAFESLLRRLGIPPYPVIQFLRFNAAGLINGPFFSCFMKLSSRFNFTRSIPQRPPGSARMLWDAQRHISSTTCGPSSHSAITVRASGEPFLSTP